MSERMKDKIVLVSGAGSSEEGMSNGRAASILYAREGATVLACDINYLSAKKTVDMIKKENGNAIAYKCDVSNLNQIKKLFDFLIINYDRIDVLHSNVGIVEVGGPEEITEKNWQKVMDINVKSLFLLTKFCLPIMIKNKGGSIIAISSIASERYVGYPSISYNASKGAINQIIQNIALQYARQNIRANCVLPGFLNTPLIKKYLKEGYNSETNTMIKKRNKMCPTGKMGDAWDVAYASLFLASDESKYITGQKLIVDGGISSQIG